MAASSAHSILLPVRVLWLCALSLTVSLAAGIDSANARSNRSYQTYTGKRVPLRPTRATEKQKEKPAPPQPVHLIVVSIPKQRISAYGARGYHVQGAVSTGTSGFPTPTGIFGVIQKNRYHRSNIYSGAPMPFMQRITWSGVAMHEGVLPGYPASHGCIRLTHKFASELWGMTRMGVRVVVTTDDGQPVEIAHPNLPAPTMTPAPAVVTEAEQAKPSLVAMSDARMAQGSAVALPAADKLLSPLDRLMATRAKMIAEAPAKAKAAKQAAQLSATAASEANKALKGLREAELALAAAVNRRTAAAKSVEDAKEPEAAEKARSAVMMADAKVEEASGALAAATAIETARTREALAAATAAWDAESASEAASAIVRAGERATEPISVFVSRKTGRVYIRQAWKAIHEAPATFKDPDTPLGTHVYVAVEMAEAGKAMQWLSMTYPQSTSGPDSKPPQQQRFSRQRGRPEPAPAADRGRPRETAAGALGRIELSDETKAFIADRLWVGASLIVSDYPLSPESPVGTEFIVRPR